MVGNHAVNGIVIAARISPWNIVARRENLQFHVAVFSRLAAAGEILKLPRKAALQWSCSNSVLLPQAMWRF